MSLTPTNHWKLGLFVMASTALGVFTLFWYGLKRLERQSVPVYAYFMEEVDGLAAGSPVKFRGVPIGEVTDIRVAEDRNFIQVKSDIYVDALMQLGLSNPFEDKVPGVDPFIDEKLAGLRVQLRTQLLTGQSFVQTVLVDDSEPKLWPAEEQRQWATLPSVNSAIKGFEESLQTVLDELPKTLQSASQTFRSMDQVIIDLEMGLVSQEARELMAALKDRVSNLERMELVLEATEAMKSLGELSAGLSSSDGNLNQALGEIAATGRRIKDELGKAELQALSRSLQGMGGSVGVAAVDLSGLLARLRTTVAGLDAALLSIRDLVAMLERDPGSLLHGRTPSVDPLRK